MRIGKIIIGITLFVLLSIIIPMQLAYARVSLLGPMTHEYTVKIGEEMKGEIVLRNPDTEDVTLKLYHRDYSFTSEGKSNYIEPGSLKRSNAVWIRLEKTRVSIAPDDTAIVKFTIKVPDDQALTGTYWSIIMVEPLSPVNLVEETGKSVNVMIHETVRYGVQIVTTIGTSGLKKLEFRKASLNTNDDGTMLLSVDIENLGERWLKPDVWVDLFKEDGTFVARFKAANKRLFPGTSVRHPISLGNLKAGKYMALVVADDGDEYVVGAEYTLNVGKK